MKVFLLNFLYMLIIDANSIILILCSFSIVDVCLVDIKIFLSKASGKSVIYVFKYENSSHKSMDFHYV